MQSTRCPPARILCQQYCPTVTVAYLSLIQIKSQNGKKTFFLSVSKSVQCKTALDSSNKPVKRVDAIVTESAKHLQLATVELLSM